MRGEVCVCVASALVRRFPYRNSLASTFVTATMCAFDLNFVHASAGS